jgi:transcriptional regulator with XRE-family HTH domain
MAYEGKGTTAKAVGARIRATRKALEYSAENLVQRVRRYARLTTNHLFVIERGEVMPSRRTLEAIAKALGKSPEWLRTGVEPKKNGHGNGNGGARK